ncbi:MAG: SH3 domain-containing protein [Oscillospiraceae bacterium]|nr:SH3 domain-containing protein [Oscillospiraceae bacterium]
MRCHRIRIAVLTGLCFSLFSTAAYAEQAIVTGNGVNVRTGPGTAFGIFTTLQKDTVVTVSNRSNSAWYEIQWDGETGYMSSAYLKLLEEDSSSPEVSSQECTPGYINGMYVYLRSAPSSSSTVLGTYSNGQSLTITGYSGDWVAVTISGKTGFIYKDYVGKGSVSAAVIDQEASDPYGGTPFYNQGSQAQAERPGGTIVIAEASQSSADSSSSAEDVTASPSPSPDAESSAAPVASVTLTPAAVASPSPPVSPSPSYSIVVINGSSGTTVTVAASPSPSPSPSVSESDTETGSSSQSVGSTDTNGTITANSVRFRSGPGTTYSILDVFGKGTAVQILGVSGDWTAVTVNGVSGFVYSQYVQTTAAGTSAQEESPAEEQPAAQMTLGLSDTQSSAVAATSDSSDIRDGYINAVSVRMRAGPSMTADILAELSYGTSLKITGSSGSWTKVICDGKSGFVYCDYITEGSYNPEKAVSSATGAALGKEIASYALSFVGYPYTWGGNSPATGFDCSGFVQYVYSQFGYTTSRVANDVLGDGVHVDPADIQPGDVLCFYSSSSYVGHVGIYIGNDTFVHAANSATGVVTTSLSEGYYALRGYEIRRII